MLWYKYSLGPFDTAGHWKHVLTAFQVAVVRHTSRCHSQSPRSSTRANFLQVDVKGVPARARSPPIKGRFDSPMTGLIPSNAELNDQASRLHTLLRVRFFTMTALGQVNSKKRLCRTEDGRNRTMFIQIATTFSTLYCVHRRALSPCNPKGIWLLVAGLLVAHGSIIARAWFQKNWTSESGTCT